MTLPLFHRSPRTPPRFPAEEVEIQAPPARPSLPTLSAATVILPIVVTAVTLGLSVAFVATQPTYLLISLPMMLISGLMG
ncbi:hypothetical protein, partial [Thermogutta sp.]|uniref:hypothetical protein n=1 Tax=Thermogutta sp. TaxID=1962930 RepID=UPI0032201756